MASRNYTDLIAWQRAMDLVVSVYRLTSTFPADERFGLTQQLRRAAVSIPSNLAEGQGRGSDAELVRFSRISHGSLRELETQLLIARRLNICREEELTHVLESAAEVGRLINGLIRSKQEPES